MTTGMKTRQWTGRNKRSGFTIVELLIVVVVMGILAAISIVAYNGIQNRASNTLTISDLKQASKQIEMSHANDGTYPLTISQVNNGEGLSNSSKTSYVYSSDGLSYQLTGYSDRGENNKYCISSSANSPQPGPCSGHEPAPESCFTFNTSDGIITNYSSAPSCPKDVIIPSKIAGNTVKGIGSSAFSGKQLTSVAIPNTVSNIWTNAFENNQLTGVAIPNSVTRIDSHSFQDNHLTSVSIPNSVTSIGYAAFLNNQITRVFIPSSVTSIGTSAFENNQLTSVSIPSSVTNVGFAAFRGNPSLTCSIPTSTPYDPYNPNMYCSNLVRN